MIISDLSHFEEVIPEAPSIVGGATTKASTVSAYELLPDFFLDLLPPKSIALLKKTKVTLKTVAVKGKGVSASVTTGTSKGGKVKFSSASSSSSSV